MDGDTETRISDLESSVYSESDTSSINNDSSSKLSTPASSNNKKIILISLYILNIVVIYLILVFNIMDLSFIYKAVTTFGLGFMYSIILFLF